MNKSRVEAFSDGVFAIAITLLVLDIRLPAGTTDEGLGEALVRLLPTAGAYLMSFFVVGLYWVYHHRNMHRIKEVNSVFLWFNLVWLMFVSVIPFPTSLIGEFPLQVWPIVIYGANLILANVTGFAFTVIMKHYPELTHVPVTKEELRWLIRRYLVTNCLYGVGIGFAWFLPWCSYAIFAGVLFWLIGSSASMKVVAGDRKPSG